MTTRVTALTTDPMTPNAMILVGSSRAYSVRSPTSAFWKKVGYQAKTSLDIHICELLSHTCSHKNLGSDLLLKRDGLDRAATGN